MRRKQNSNCKLSILVPIFNETEGTLSRLFDSLTYQEHVTWDEFEVICVVNNDLPGSIGYKKVYEANQCVLRMNWLNMLRNIKVVVIDRSSLGREIPGCNIGKARDILVREAAERFKERNYNGVLLNVDADVYFNDRLFMRKAIDMFTDPEVIGVVGGKWREAFVADHPEYKPEELRDALRLVGLSKQCKELSNFLKGKQVLQAFGGSNMLSRCFETIDVGGIKHLDIEEDKDFGYRLWAHANNNGKKILIKKTELKVVAAFRISERTASTFKDEIDQFFRGEELIVKHPATPERLVVNHETYQLLKARALKLPGGKELVEYIEDYGILWIR